MPMPQPVQEQRQTGLSVGEMLRLRREQFGWSLADVADSLRIKPAYLQAIEDGRPQDLPGSTYALGFLRSYAAMLGLDGLELSRQFRQESGLQRRTDLRFPAPVPERGVPAGAAVLMGVVLLGLAYAGWYRFGGHETLPVQTVPPLPASLAPYDHEQSHPAAASPQVATMLPATAPPPPPAVTPPASTPSASAPPASSPPASAPAASTPPISTTSAANPPTEPGFATSSPATPPGPAVQAPPAASPAPAPVTSQPVTVKALASSWVQIRQQGGPVIYEHILQPGESWSVPPDSGPLRLSTGNAGGIVLSAGGVTTPVLGRPGMVRRNLPLNADAIRDGSILAQPAGAARRPEP
jgi:cytoskeleton protein RodZ